MVCDARGVPLHFTLSGGQASDISHAQPLLDGVYLPTKGGQPRKRCRKLLADKGYDSDALRRYCDRYTCSHVIPFRAMKRKPKPGLPRLLDRPKYKERNVIERLFGWLKEHRRLGTRYCSPKATPQWSRWLAGGGVCDITPGTVSASSAAWLDWPISF